MGAGVEAIECKKCKFPRRKDYKHVCERAYGHGRRAGPAPTTVRTSRTELRHAIGYSGELRCAALETHHSYTRVAWLLSFSACSRRRRLAV